jgi:UDP-N-acetylmuramate--alanine ligase
MFRKRDTHIHFVGIGGIGMSGIAEVLVNLGYPVTGTDLADTETTRRLQALGATVHRGHGAEMLGDADVVVVSSAVRADNPEVLAARQRKIPVIPRAEMLAELMRLKQGVAIGGSHGKTTTTSLVATVLQRGGLDPTVVIGGKLNALGSNARLGSGRPAGRRGRRERRLVLDADARRRGDHQHRRRAHGPLRDDGALLEDAFVGFANRVPFYGLAVVCSDDPKVAAMLPRLTKRYVTYGFKDGADYTAHDLRHDGPLTHFQVRARGEELGEFALHMPGVHNVLNALATIAVCGRFRRSRARRPARRSLEFTGVQRRFTVRGTAGGVMVVDDYGHHPTEIRATLAGARTSYPERRLVAVFQPHRYSRVRDHLEGFAAASTSRTWWC